VPDSYYDAIIKWFGRRHNWKIQRDWIIYTSGVVPAISAVVKAFTELGDKVVVQTPVYNCFFSSIRNQGCEIVENKLLPVCDEDDNYTYKIDFDDLERKLSDDKVKIFLLCNPHNPACRVWTKEELAHINELCLKHDVLVVSDEIHCEIVMPGYKFTPFASVNKECQDNCITLNSPTKAFNIAGLQIANIVTNNKDWYNRIDKVINIFELCDVNPFGVIALQEAYNNGEMWLKELNEYIQANYTILHDYIAAHLPYLKVYKLEGTYLAWIDITATNMTSEAITDKLLKAAKVMVNSGTMYGAEAGKGYIRVNLATPQQILKEGLKRIKNALS
jgi:cystathionine beta-lyase